MAEDIKQILNEYKEETNRHFDVVAEDIKSKIETVSEQVAINTEQITSLQEDVKIVKDDMGKVKDDVEVIKLDIEVIKNDLKQKVSREEFVILEKRVGMLEAKSRK